MNVNNKNKEADFHSSSEEFVARHWRRNAFRRPLLGSLVPRPVSWTRRIAVAAAACVAVAAVAWVVSASLEPTRPAQSPENEQTVAPAPAVRNPEPLQLKIEFTDAPLPEVVARIEEVYGVSVSGDAPASLRLTLSYEGTAADLVETINMTLGTSLEVEPRQ